MLTKLLVGIVSALVLVSCVTRFSEVAPRGGWRAEAEIACMDRRAELLLSRAGEAPAVEQTDPLAIVELPAIVEGECGMDRPLKVSALAGGRTVISPTPTLGCPLTEALEAWLGESVQPAAIAWIGSPVVEIEQISAYACRKRNNFGSGFSEHAFGNALDIAGFKFANGRKITFAKDWNSTPKIESFFREIFATACQRYTTVLGPGFNILHFNHIHIDLAIVAPDNSPKMCKPMPEVTPPQRTPFESGLIAGAAGQSNTDPSSALSTLPAAAAPVATDTAIPGVN